MAVRITANFESNLGDIEAFLARMAGSDIAIRQRVGGEYLLLYAVRGSSAFLLSIRHQRQLSFDLAAHWP